ncbi:MotA/TolQ/ExbB proton channel family protein [Opitutae bacterium]|nr:MotA/TolQ/ExbB proton channel family protein [Opitutae bacterium]
MELNNLNISLDVGPMMFPLLALAFIGFIIFLERTLFLHKGQINIQEFISGIKNLLKKGRLVEAVTLCEEMGGSAAHLVKTVLLNYDASVDLITAHLRKRLSLEIPSLERRIGILSVVARISPLIGFLGTLIAGIEIINNLSFFDGASGMLIAALANALFSSALGLVICILATAGHHFLEVRITHVIHDYEWLSSELLEVILEERSLSSSTSTATNPKAGDEYE